jgi:phosphatidylcholine synthase
MWPAALVHLFTASGILCGLMATQAVLHNAWQEGFIWLGVALVIDGIDGTFARMAKVHRWLPRFSGERLDLVVDYVTYVFVPTLALLQGGFLPGGWGMVLAGLILLSSLFHFCDTESKAEDHSFVGFPAVWNLVAFYVFAFALPPLAAALLVLACVGLTFVPLKWAHPLRTRRLWQATGVATVLWLLAVAQVLSAGFPAGPWAQAVLLLVTSYFVGLAVHVQVPGFRGQVSGEEEGPSTPRGPET